MIIGDVMIDTYLWGKVERISPEAPVPVVTGTKEENRLGGAANEAAPQPAPASPEPASPDGGGTPTPESPASA